MSRVKRNLGWALVLMACGACADAFDGFGKTCTDAGCLTFLRVQLTFESGLTAGDIEVIVEHGAKSFACDFSASNNPCHKGFHPDFDPGATGDETPGAVVVLLNEAPKQLRITVTAGGESETQLLQPEYQRSQPNGPECGPTCFSSRSRLQFGL